MTNDFTLSLDFLIKDELDGKASAIARYDDIIWKIRTGYAVILYGAVGIVAGLVNQKTIVLASPALLSTAILIIGFSLFGALLDFSFVSAKLRVVQGRDKLIELVFSRFGSASQGGLEDGRLLIYLKNSGERKERVDWSQRVGGSIPLIYYGGTAAVCICAIGVLAR